MPKIKFMGSSHEHKLRKGDDFGGQLSEGLPNEVKFNRENNWVVDSDEAGLSEDAVKILVKTEDFKDVSDLKRVPTNVHQQVFLGMPKSEGGDDEGDEGDEQVLGSDAADLPADGEPAKGTSVTDDTPTTTTGGSTRGGRGGRAGGST